MQLRHLLQSRATNEMSSRLPSSEAVDHGMHRQRRVSIIEAGGGPPGEDGLLPPAFRNIGSSNASLEHGSDGPFTRGGTDAPFSRLETDGSRVSSRTGSITRAALGAKSLRNFRASTMSFRTKRLLSVEESRNAHVLKSLDTEEGADQTAAMAVPEDTVGKVAFYCANFFGYEYGEAQSKKGNVLLHPAAPFTAGWEFISAVLLIYTTSVTPFVIAFFSSEEGYCGQPPTLAFDMIVDVFFLLEIPKKLMTGMYVHGAYVRRSHEIFRAYRTRLFLVDAPSALPIAWMEFFFVPNVSCDETPHFMHDFFRWLRLIRMLRMLRILKVLKIFNVLREVFRMKPNVVRLLKATFSVCMIAHVGGCAWWYIKVHQGAEHVLAYREAYDIMPNDFWSAYLSCLYFMIATLCTVGYGDIRATNDIERVFTIFVMLLGASVFAIIVSNMSALVNSMVSAENLLNEEMDRILDYLRERGASRDLEMHVTSFYRHKAGQTNDITHGSDMLSALPPKLQKKIKSQLTRTMLGQVPMFDNLSEKFIEDLLGLVALQTFSPGEIIFQQGQPGDAMYIVVRGDVEVWVEQQSKEKTLRLLEVLHKGDVLGDTALIEGGTRNATAYARTYVDVHVVYKENFEALCASHPGVHESLVKMAKAQASKNNDLNDEIFMTRSRWERRASIGGASAIQFPQESPKERGHRTRFTPLMGTIPPLHVIPAPPEETLAPIPVIPAGNNVVGTVIDAETVIPAGNNVVGTNIDVPETVDEKSEVSGPAGPGGLNKLRQELIDLARWADVARPNRRTDPALSDQRSASPPADANDAGSDSGRRSLDRRSLEAPSQSAGDFARVKAHLDLHLASFRAEMSSNLAEMRSSVAEMVKSSQHAHIAQQRTHDT